MEPVVLTMQALPLGSQDSVSMLTGLHSVHTSELIMGCELTHICQLSMIKTRVKITNILRNC